MADVNISFGSVSLPAPTGAIAVVYEDVDGNNSGPYIDPVGNSYNNMVAKSLSDTTTSYSAAQLDGSIDNDYAIEVVEENTPTYRVPQASHVASYDISSEDSDPRGIEWKPDGTRVYIVGNGTDSVYQYDAGTPFDASTLTLNGSKDVSSTDTFPEAISWSNDGTKAFILGTTDTIGVLEYNASTAWDITSISYSQKLDPPQSNIHSIAWNEDGTKLFFNGLSGDTVYQYGLSTPFDVSTATKEDEISVTGFATIPIAMSWDDSGHKLYILNLVPDSDDVLYEIYTPSKYKINPYNVIRNKTLVSNSLGARGMAWGEDGGKLYVVDTNDSSIDEYTLGEQDITATPEVGEPVSITVPNEDRTADTAASYTSSASSRVTAEASSEVHTTGHASSNIELNEVFPSKSSADLDFSLVTSPVLGFASEWVYHQPELTEPYTDAFTAVLDTLVETPYKIRIQYDENGNGVADYTTDPKVVNRDGRPLSFSELGDKGYYRIIISEMRRNSYLRRVTWSPTGY